MDINEKKQIVKAGLTQVGVPALFDDILAASEIDPETRRVTVTENGVYMITPDSSEDSSDDGYDGLSAVEVTVDVSAPSGGSVLVLKRKSGVTLPYTKHYDYDPETGDLIEIRDREPIGLLTSDIAAHAYGFSCEFVDTMQSTDNARYDEFNLPFSFDHFTDPGGEHGKYNYFIFTGVDVPGATLTVDTTYFDIVELPAGFSADFNTEVAPVE